MCLNPVRMESRDYQPIPCGKCYECKKRIVHGWAFRLMQEEKRCISSLFITLTYDPENVPFTRSGRQSLWKKDVQLFFKRLRKAHTKSGEVAPIKYFLCGEYGGSTKRPHYHCILFNTDVANIEASWQLGLIHYGAVGSASVYYTLKYMMKRPPKMRRNDAREREFRLMSKGLGEQYCIRANNKAWHRVDIENRMYLTVEGGKKIGMPRYYKDKIYNEEEREQAAYAGLLKARELAKKDKLSYETKQQRLLASYFSMEFESLSRNKI